MDKEFIGAAGLLPLEAFWYCARIRVNTPKLAAETFATESGKLRTPKATNAVKPKLLKQVMVRLSEQGFLLHALSTWKRRSPRRTPCPSQADAVNAKPQAHGCTCKFERRALQG